MNLEIERIGNTIVCVSDVIHKLLESCTIEDKKDVMKTIDAVCYITEYIEIQAEKLVAISTSSEWRYRGDIQ